MCVHKLNIWSVPFTSTACPDCLPRSIVVIICCVYSNSIQNSFLICLFDCSPLLLNNFRHSIMTNNSKISPKVLRSSCTCLCIIISQLIISLPPELFWKFVIKPKLSDTNLSEKCWMYSPSIYCRSHSSSTHVTSTLPAKQTFIFHMCVHLLPDC